MHLREYRLTGGRDLSVKFGVIVFPGTWSDRDFHHVLEEVLGQEVEYVWHKETDLSTYDCVILPGGSSYSDYPRPGAIARFSPVMGAVERFAAGGGLVLGSCNGFQILCEAGLLPGVLLRNVHLQHRCQWVHLQMTNTTSPFVAGCSTGQVLRMPISHYEGCYFADEATLAELEANGQVVLRYSTPSGEITEAANPNGSLSNIAGITNAEGNVLGMMPHPERCCEEILGGTDGRAFFDSILSV
ncbi:MAG: Phosphoribosylformylglycinamidine synthase subunit PurQ [Chloroflexi bacterium]|nr:Phosphoribosylformylglycinamidine synthase subunit PurQ [Chloroflexota bacterium]